MVPYLHDLLSIRSCFKMSQISKPVRVVIELLFRIPYKMNEVQFYCVDYLFISLGLRILVKEQRAYVIFSVVLLSRQHQGTTLVICSPHMPTIQLLADL